MDLQRGKNNTGIEGGGHLRSQDELIIFLRSDFSILSLSLFILFLHTGIFMDLQRAKKIFTRVKKTMDLGRLLAVYKAWPCSTLRNFENYKQPAAVTGGL